MKKLLLSLGFGMIATIGFSQAINGIVKDADGKALHNATVSLLNAKDSSVVKLNVTNEMGQYKFESISKGKF